MPISTVLVWDVWHYSDCFAEDKHALMSEDVADVSRVFGTLC